MGILKAVRGSVGGMFADQWKDFFLCEGMPQDVLVASGYKHVSERSSNTRSTDGIISDGSVINVNEGTSAIVIDGGKLLAVFEEPGEHVFKSGASPSIFAGTASVGDLAAASAKDAWERVGFGGVARRGSQRVYYINRRELPGFQYSTKAPIPFCVRDDVTGAVVDCGVNARITYSIRVVDVTVLYHNLVGNVFGGYRVGDLRPQLDAYVLSQLQVSLATFSGRCDISRLSDAIPDIACDVREGLSATLKNLWGIEIPSVAFESLRICQEDLQKIQELQRARPLTDASFATAALASARAEAMQEAAANANAGGAMFFMPTASEAKVGGACPAKAEPAVWKCDCGWVSADKYCRECGKKRPF